jgi:hypothetical protein
VDKTAQTGPRPYFSHTYLERVAAYWPNEPEPPATRVEYEIPAPEVRDSTAEDPMVDIRR